MAGDAQPAAACFVVKRNNRTRATVPVHFNPASLSRTIESSLKGKTTAAQYVADVSASLSMELIYDTTTSGDDVRTFTNQLATLLQPYATSTSSGRTKRKPPLVEFQWGAYLFEGVVTAYKETIDFFAPTGVPLRASVNLTLKKQAKQMELTERVGQTAGVGGSVTARAVSSSGPRGVTDPATDGGDPDAAQDVAATNGEENMRFPANDSLIIDPDDGLLPPAAFAGAGAAAGASAGFGAGASAGFDAGASAGFGAGASAGFGAGASAGFGAGASAGFGAGASAGFGAGASAGFDAGASAGFGAGASAGFDAGASAGFGAGASAGFGAGASAGFGAGASAGFGAGASAGFGAGASAGFGAGASAGFSAGGGAVYGASASAGVAASAGAFAGLRAGHTTSGTARLDVDHLAITSSTAHLSTDSQASFQLGGKAELQSSAGLRADVGAGATLNRRIRFDDE